MPSTAALVWIHALTPLRVGTDEGLGAVNLPTLREAHTRHPIYPGSSLKGVLRAEVESINAAAARQLFGPDRLQAGDHRGALSFTDAHLIALPVRSLLGTFAWCSCPYVLHRLNRDRRDAGRAAFHIPESSGARGGDAGWAPDRVLISGHSRLADPDQSGKVFIEEYTLDAAPSEEVSTLARAIAAEVWPGDTEAEALFVGRFALLSDDAFNNLAQIAMELRTRVCIDPSTGTAEESGPWTEEAMPAESLLAGLVVGKTTRVFERQNAEDEGAPRRRNEETLAADTAIQRLRGYWPTTAIRLGGHNSSGMGRAHVRIAPGEG